MFKTILLTTLLSGGIAFGTPKSAPELYNLDYPLAELGDYSIREVFTEQIDGGEQLITNGDFEDGTNDWTMRTITYTSPNTFNNDTLSADYMYQLNKVNTTEKFYFVMTAKYNFGVSLTLRNIGGTIVLTFDNTDTSIITKSDITIPLGTGVYLYFSSSSSFDINNLYVFNISTLITNKQYSPIYDDTFDNLTDEQIKLQMDDFIARPYQWLNFDEVGELTDGQIDYWYEMYNTLLWFEDAEIPIGNQIIIDDVFILISGMILYILGCVIAYLTGIRWVYAIAGILWFIPIFIFDNLFIIVFSSAMLIISATIAFYTKE